MQIDKKDLKQGNNHIYLKGKYLHYTMQAYYKKQVEVAREFSISEGTITNWIKGSLAGKNNLQLFNEGKDYFIIKNEHNRVVMLNLAEKGRKFRSEESEVDVVVKDELYEVMKTEYVISLTNSLIINSEIPIKYGYLGRGAELWDEFFQSLNNMKSYGLDSQEFLWETSLKYLKPLVDNFDRVNLIDLGPGNFEPGKFWIDYLIKYNKFGCYLPIDISDSDLELTIKNFKKSYPEKLLGGYNTNDENKYIKEIQADLDKDSLEKIVNKIKNYSKKEKTINIFLFLGGTMGIMENQVRFFLNVKDAMLPNDYLIIDNALDILTNRTVFPVSQSEAYDNMMLYIARLLGIDDEYFEKEFRYNEQTAMREYNLILNRNLNIHFKKFNIIVELKKGQRINVWKHRRDTFEFISDKIKQAGMELQFIAKHPTDPEVIYMSKLV
ncbi:MAG: L-histidine N(alpha)-methyltransferase [bacterium]